ncbi:hypothetical protein GCM10027446_08260 [Angustibacter peucedani]
MTTAPARALVLLRILTLYPVALAWASSRPDRVELVLAVVLVVGTALLALRWDRVVPVVRRHPGLAAVDVAVSLVVLSQTGAGSPFVAYTMTTAVLVGLFFSRLGAVLLTALLGAGYLLIARHDAGDRPVVGLLGVPAAFVVLACAGAAFRGLHDRLAAAVQASVAAERSAATARERTRLARDLHDGVSSTLQGVVLQSMAVERVAATSDDPKVAELAADLQTAVRSALAQSREVLTGLRREDDSAPLVQAVADRAHRWAERTGVPVDFTATGVADVDASSRIAALRVLDEALENVERHAGAARVQVALTGDDRSVRLVVEDDGTGMAADRPGVRDGHYGVLGMTERAGVAGGRLTFEPATPDADRPGTRVRLELPRTPCPREDTAATAVDVREPATDGPRVEATA